MSPVMMMFFPMRLRSVVAMSLSVSGSPKMGRSVLTPLP
jgi:hypothetical protein